SKHFAKQLADENCNGKQRKWRKWKQFKFNNATREVLFIYSQEIDSDIKGYTTTGSGK
ncbi:unnamed protein product, partial [Ceratitis capitata]